MGRKLLTSPGVADTYTFLMNTWDTLLESYQQRVYNNTLATVKHQIQQVENPMPAEVISMEAARVENAILLDHLTYNVALEEPEIRSSDPNIPMNNYCTDDELHFGMPGASGDFEDEAEAHDATPTTSQRWRAVTELQWIDLGTSDVDGYQGEVGDDADVDKKEEVSQVDVGSTQNVDD
jgi:hypothetical protein